MELKIALSAAGMLLAGSLFLIIFKTRKRDVPISYIAFGALAWFVAVILKFAWAIPINHHVQDLLHRFLLPELANPLFWIYVGLLTGIFECGLIWLIFRFSRLGNASLSSSYGFGYGFGCIEAILLGLSQIASLVAIATGKLPSVGLSWLVVPAPIIERVMTIFLHLYTTLLIIYSIKESKPSLFWLSFLYKSFVDTIAAWAQLAYGIDTTAHLWTVEGLIFIVTLPSVLGAIQFLKRETPATENHR
jgi:uncharacterized membrane protein YhfC